MKFSEKSSWIWLNKQEKDSYGEFYDEFIFDGSDATIRISADSDYVVYINGEYVLSGQYPDFPHYKVYDEYDVSKHLKQGKNKICIIVWYYGESFMTYYLSDAKLRYEISSGDNIIAFSDKNTMSRLSKCYKNGLCYVMTPQIGFGYNYDLNNEDNWLTSYEDGFSESKELNLDIPLHKRAIKKLKIGSKAKAELIKQSDGYYLFDLGMEEVGYLTFKIKSNGKTKIRVCYGEHIKDGCVRASVGGREFNFDITLKDGINEYTNYFRRLGLRYLELHTNGDILIDYVTVLPCWYPLSNKPKSFDSDIIQRIYDVSKRTLTLCLHDHYEDCPWREQAFYAMDSRNQMLCGYFAFDEYAVPRDNLILMSKDNRVDGLLSITTPTSKDLAIVSFSLHYFTEVYEYLLHSNDISVLNEIMPKLKSLMQVFVSKLDNDGIMKNFDGEAHWNFYEWTDDLDGWPRKDKGKNFDAANNCLLSIALSNMQKICDMAGETAEYANIAEALNNAIHTNFYNQKTGLFINTLGEENYSELVNSLAILCGAANKTESKKIAEVLTSENTLTKASLSMLCFKYDALIKCEKEEYKEYIIDDIVKKYSKMLDADATTFWETELGESDFENAGSLCHGWSAMPVYYFSKLLKAKEDKTP